MSLFLSVISAKESAEENTVHKFSVITTWAHLWVCHLNLQTFRPGLHFLCFHHNNKMKPWLLFVLWETRAANRTLFMEFYSLNSLSYFLAEHERNRKYPHLPAVTSAALWKVNTTFQETRSLLSALYYWGNFKHPNARKLTSMAWNWKF